MQDFQKTKRGGGGKNSVYFFHPFTVPNFSFRFQLTELMDIVDTQCKSVVNCHERFVLTLQVH